MRYAKPPDNLPVEPQQTSPFHWWNYNISDKSLKKMKQILEKSRFTISNLNDDEIRLIIKNLIYFYSIFIQYNK